MNWLLFAGPLLLGYIIWFGYLLFKRRYDRSLALFAFAHIPYLLINLVAPFRGILDPDYAGYSLGLIQLPKGIWVTIIVGLLVLFCIFLMSRTLMDRMKGLWMYAFLFDLALVIMVALPVLYDILTNLDSFRVELGEEMQFSGSVVAIVVLFILTIPSGWACYFSAKKAFAQNGTSVPLKLSDRP